MDSLRERRFGEPGETLAEAGEGALLDRLATIAALAGPHPASGPAGDDGALWRVPAGRDLVVSQDCQVEDVDFRRAWIGPHRLGRRALAVALSDLAAMGARPAYALATLCAPAATAVDDVAAIQAGLCEAAAESGCVLIGGDVSDINGPLVIDVSVAGTAEPGTVLRRDAGAPGDLLVVTGMLGRAAAGLALLREPALVDPAGADAATWMESQLEPVARLREGEALVGAGVRCAGDLSDGLWVDAGRTARASRCAAELWVDALPVDAALRRCFPTSWADLALGGGEDFELLVACSPDEHPHLLASWSDGCAPLTVVGRLVEGSGVRCLESREGRTRPAPRVSSRHYR
jgi:thiamine-monophosphate kinase